jgi:hypothetical protein
MKNKTTEAKPKIPCPCCGKILEVGKDAICRDFYVQCRNRRCSFDGWTAGTIAELVTVNA